MVGAPGGGPAAFASADGWRPDSRADYLDVAVSGVLVTAAADAFSSSASSTPPAPWARFAWPLLADERLDALDAVGLGVGILGVGVITDPNQSAFPSGSAGQLLPVFGAACLALGSVLSRRVDSSLPSLAVTGWGSCSAGRCSTPRAPRSGDPCRSRTGARSRTRRPSSPWATSAYSPPRARTPPTSRF